MKMHSTPGFELIPIGDTGILLIHPEDRKRADFLLLFM
ncbi:hypothetical protein GQS_00665 [Thermococcus sp. 4557]|nr:hypothetical protein GQS_00665 [Thermococcus sp. 4557]